MIYRDFYADYVLRRVWNTSFSRRPPRIFLLLTPPARCAPRDYQPVTAERLKRPVTGLLIRQRTYDGWGYSPALRDYSAAMCRQA